MLSASCLSTANRLQLHCSTSLNTDFFLISVSATRGDTIHNFSLRSPTSSHPPPLPHPILHKFFTNHQCSASSSTVMDAHSDESQTKPLVHSLEGDNSHLEERRKISPQGYTSWMASGATQHQELGWSRMESGCVFLLMLVPVQTSSLVQPI